MAENEAKDESTSIATKEEQKNQGPLLAIFPDFRINFPPLFKRETKQVSERTNTGEEESKTEKSGVVKFPQTRKDFPALKLEVEESEQGMNPRNMWPVYALGGFMILRWVLARWKERKADNSDKPSPGDEEPPSMDD